ncbi:hypothetical protein [Thiomonas sp. Sup16B3]|uniref:hypothetical protein n=1 Tax=Thiomonas sp. Sup16B3 TaxID=2493109 RepID=UPI0012DF0BD7|nr:hypothetical protein [Thiomonas sp. Sup16B3]
MKQPETDLNSFDVNVGDYLAVREAREELAAIGARLAKTTARRNETWNLLCMGARAPDEESGVLARTRRLLSGDTTASRSGAGSPAPEELGREYRQLVNEEELLKSAQQKLLTKIDREISRATEHRKAQPDFAQAREALVNAALNLLEVHRAGFELAERIADKGFDLSEATDGWSGAHLPRELAESLERVVGGERVIPLDLQRYTANLINRTLTHLRTPEKPSFR